MNFFEKRRADLGRTQWQIAVALEMTPAAVSAWETDKSIPDLSLAAKLAKVYEVDVARIEREIVALHRVRREAQPAA